MTIDDDKLDELERCAEAATDGEWFHHGLSVVDAHPDCDDDAGPGLVADCFPGDIDEAHNLPAHIAAADPPTVLALVRELRRLREEMQREREIDSLAAEAIEGTAAAEEFHREMEKKGFYDE